MSAIITEKFRLHNAEQFYESFTETSPSTYYFFIGKHSSYIDDDNYGYSANDNVPPPPRDDVQTEYYKWDSMLAAKLISSADVSYVIPRVDWKTNTTFDMYQHDIRGPQGTDSVGNVATNGATSLWNSSFYFMTEDYRVYKVLDNNGGSQFTGVKPEESTPGVPFYAGGYYLLYMYTLTTTQVEKFLTNDFIPVSVDTAVSQAAENNSGAIQVLRITPGAGYLDPNNNNNFTVYSPIRGDGSDGVVEIVVSGGAIQPFGNGDISGNTIVYDAGQNYTYATVDLSDVYEEPELLTQTSMGASIDGVTGGLGGLIEPIIPPKVGHGYNAIEELGGHFVMMNARLEQSEGDDLTVANDFREIGIVVDPLNYGTLTKSTAVTRRQSFAVKFTNAPTTDFIIDEKITQSTTGAVGRVVEWDADNNILYYLQERHSGYGVNSARNYVPFSGANTITGDLVSNGGSGASAVPSSETSEIVTLSGGNNIEFSNGYCLPELEPDSGKIIYVENRRPISRAPDQTEDIKIIVEF